MVKQQARLWGLDTNAQVIIMDGPPGIGCPVISAATGADLTLIVVEPTLASIHDMERVLNLTRHFRLPAIVCINKADIYPQGTNQITNYCHQEKIEIVGRIPYDETVTQAMVNGEPVTAYMSSSTASQALNGIWQRVDKILKVEMIGVKAQ
jgi:MinD superfamily P-loop ATPase